MIASDATEEQSLPSDRRYYDEKRSQLVDQLCQAFDRCLRRYVIFSLSFLSIGVLELVGFVLCFSFLSRSSLLAVSLAVMFLTLFSYFVLRLYFQSKKTEDLADVLQHAERTCKASMPHQEGQPEHHLFLANSLARCASSLRDKEYSYYKPPELLEIFGPLAEKLSCWWHWEDLHRMQEMLLQRSIDEHIKLVKCAPTDLEVHAGLANAYVLLSALYAPPRPRDGDDERWVPPERESQQMRERFRHTAEKAIEEFKILSHYAPDDPWIHAQLAYSYHDLQMPEEEIRSYEAILSLRPGDVETLLKLGMLYFQQGHNAKGLQIYEQLRRSHHQQAEKLIAFYGGVQ